MKFRVAPKDFAIFIAFCVFLLYLCAIAVLNFSSFANDGSFYGLNPIEAFYGDKIILTLMMFVCALIIIFSSVSSYIFERTKSSKHFLTFKEKEEKGYSRWAKEKEIKEDKGVAHVKASDSNVMAAGIPLINNGTDIWVDNGEYHNLIIGSTGSGKTETVVKPMVNLLAKKGESMIITDPKGELYKYCASYLKEQGYNVIVLNFRDPQNGNAWNPLSLPYRYYQAGDTDKATELLDDVALNILNDPNSKDPFWEKSAADYFSGLALGLFLDAKEEEVNLNSINFMSTIGEERFATSTYIKEYFNLKGESSSPYIFASNTINAPTDTKGGITSTFRQKIRLFSSREKLSEMLAYSDFDMRSIGKQKTAVFMIIHDEKTTYHSLLTIFIKQCYETLIDVAKENGGKLPYRTNFILDEFANMPPLKDVDSMVSAARSRDIRFTFIIQNFSQLNDVYGKEVAEVIKGNCGNWIYLISTEMAALEEISKMCGEVKSGEKDKTASTPLVTVTDLQKMRLFEVIVIRLRMNPFKTKLEPDFKMDWGIERKMAELPIREMREISLFDLKKYVSEEKRKKMMQDMENQPEGSQSPFNPFMPPNGGEPNLFGNPFGPSSMFPNQMPKSNPFMPNNLSDSDIDRMIADIDKKLKELDEEEAKEKQKKQENPFLAELPKPLETSNEMQEKHGFAFMNPVSIDENHLKPQEPVLPKLEPKQEDKPKINVDADSIIMNDNLITDDEFFDDFFGDE
ncbi:MAG: type IV secretory system conjugative DNA transfer family protein [Bacilli bacterium]|jgi:type IV secretory pathway TraG/TraD family ATPase VirD4|nr:type IV secretory system conjugative DNA transfer family protein [Bacilli bacterium]